MKIALFLKTENDELSTLLISKIGEYELEFDQENPDVVIFVGGDGTLLRAVHEFSYRRNNVCYVGINSGSLGYCCDYKPSEIDRLFNDIINNNLSIENHRLLKAEFGGNEILALNEIRIENPFHTLISDVFVENETLETFRGNGLNISSNFGSAAYNKSLGGSVVMLENNVLQLTEIAPINNRIYSSLNSSLIIDGNKTILLRGNFSEAVIGYDHLTTRCGNDDILVYLSDINVRILYKKEHSTIEQIRYNFIK